MDFEFDKEIDFLLRQTARGEAVLSAENQQSKIENQKSPHLDADEIAAFAENALPEKARLNYVAHFADCDRCRKILSNLIALNAETQSEIIHRDESPVLIAAPTELPWYRRLFAVPNLVYVMGALVLMFSGIALYTVLQNSGREQNSMISQTSERQLPGKGMSSDGDAAISESYSSNAAANSNATAMSNAASMNSTASVTNSAVMPAPMSAANTNVSVRRNESEKDLLAESKSAASDDDVTPTDKQDAPAVLSAAPPPPPPAKQENYSLDGSAKTQPPSNSAPQAELNKPAAGVVVRPLPSPALRTDKKAKESAPRMTEDRERSNSTTSVGGKSFRRENNVWYDTAYRGQATTNVARGTNEYKNLDSGLRGIAENLGGTVVVVWKQKAYRIQ